MKVSIMKNLTLLILTFIVGCQEKNTTFIWSEKNNSNLQRSIQNVTLADSLDLDELEKFYVLDLVQDNDFLYVLEGDKNEILKIKKDNFQIQVDLTFKEGRGPGEILSITDYDVNNEFLMIFDQKQQKIVLFDKKGSFVREFITEEVVIDKIKFLENEKLLTYSMSQNEYIFNIIDFKGIVENSFISFEPELHFLMYTGDFVIYDKFLYFAGYSEPILKKYSLENKKQIYSVSVIDSYESSTNYVKSELGGYRMAGYSPGALYASLGMTVDSNRIYATPHHNGTPGYKYVDMYDVEDGQYISSIQVKHYPKLRGIQVENNYIYTLESRRDNNWLFKYILK